VETRINIVGQHDLFEVSAQRWKQIPGRCRQDLKTLLTQLLIQAIQEQAVISNQENSHASKSEAEPFRANCFSLSAAIQSATTY
jgi:hypothetical protein